MTGQRPIRASDQDRECAVEVLRAAFAAGCLDRGELEQRSGDAYRARTLGDLSDLTADLPGWLLDRPVERPGQYRDERPRRRGPPAGRWGFILAAIPLILVWLLVLVRAQERGLSHPNWKPARVCLRWSRTR